MTTPTDARYRITRATGDLLVPAASRLAQASSGLDNAGEQLLAAARLHAISFRHFWVSTDADGHARQACLVVPGSGRTGMCFTTRPETPDEVEELARVIDRACASLSDKVVRLAQALVDPGEHAQIEAHTRARMPVLATLLYLKRPMHRKRDVSGESLPTGVELVGYRPGVDETELAGLLPSTYEGTLDCPELSTVRRPVDVIASHRAAGAWTPDLWWIIHVDGEPNGVALFNPIPEQDAIELVYFGLTPGVRGRGLGARLLRCAFDRFAGRDERFITCACDERNTPAMRMYTALGMLESERRIALVRVIGDAT